MDVLEECINVVATEHHAKKATQGQAVGLLIS